MTRTHAGLMRLLEELEQVVAKHGFSTSYSEPERIKLEVSLHTDDFATLSEAMDVEQFSGLLSCPDKDNQRCCFLVSETESDSSVWVHSQHTYGELNVFRTPPEPPYVEPEQAGEPHDSLARFALLEME